MKPETLEWLEKHIDFVSPTGRFLGRAYKNCRSQFSFEYSNYKSLISVLYKNYKSRHAVKEENEGVFVEQRPLVAPQKFLPKYYALRRIPPIRVYIHEAGLKEAYGGDVRVALEYLRNIYDKDPGVAKSGTVLALMWGSLKPDIAKIISFFGFEETKDKIFLGPPLALSWAVKNGVRVGPERYVKADLFNIVSMEEKRIRESNADLDRYLTNNPYQCTNR